MIVQCAASRHYVRPYCYCQERDTSSRNSSLSRQLSTCPLEAAKRPHEIGDRRADLNRTVFLDEMDALHCDFRLIRPGAAKLALAAMVERARSVWK